MAAHTLKTQLRLKMCRSVVDDQQFIPRDSLADIMTHENIRSALKAKRVHDNDDLVDFIRARAPVVFATLADINQIRAITEFHETGFDDTCLPIEYVEYESGGFEVRRDSFSTGTTGPHPSLVFESWDPDDMAEFHDRQWKFMSPVLDMQQYSYVFASKTILPIDTIHDERPGGFSKVSRVRIHPAHLRGFHMKDGRPPDMAMKEQEVAVMSKREVETLELIKHLQHPHLIDVYAALEREDTSYILFPWADGGNLRDFWMSRDPATMGTKDIEWFLSQLEGMAEAIYKLHNFEKTRNYRHGDLKPENILVFGDKLVIGDVGLAKLHSAKTSDRPLPTTSMPGTKRYEPPDIKNFAPRSRVYDIWCFGCIFLEFTIWLLYGKQGLQDFNKGFKESTSTFWEFHKTSNTPIIHEEVQHWLDCMRKDDPRCEDGITVLGDLMKLIRDRMLVFTVADRADSIELLESLRDMRRRTMPDAKGRSHPYLTSCAIRRSSLTSPAEKRRSQVLRKSRANSLAPDGIPQHSSATVESSSSSDFEETTIEVPLTVTPQLITPDAPDEGHGNVHTSIPRVQNPSDYLNDIWEAVANHEFANRVFSLLFPDGWQHPEGVATSLCSRCSSMDIWSGGFFTEDIMSSLEQRAPGCHLCRLFLNCAMEHGKTSQDIVRFHRIESTFHFERHGPAVLSILKTPQTTSVPAYVHTGLPCLPSMASDQQFALISEWLHSFCPVSTDGLLPTRVLDVSPSSSSNNSTIDNIRLHTALPGQRGRYLALSHRWGSPQEHRSFCTRQTNLDSFMKGGILWDALPRTFQDAIAVTRRMGIAYLWIDSLCIVQDDMADWERESRRMEDVYSEAYCTLAATRARGTCDGFLQQTANTRGFVTMGGGGDDKKGESRYFICRMIDRFGEDVEQSGLNQRGWVLQERALSRRVIHFAASQMYYECGNGVQCETLVKLQNAKASLLGDPSFPRSSSTEQGVFSSRGGRIRIYETVYKLYSTLHFTNERDRAVAIRGLEKRLATTFDTSGGLGIFDGDYLIRSLMWQRETEKKGDCGDDMRLGRIEFPRWMHVPSWSWMAWRGPITYVDIPFGGVIWAQGEGAVRPPFRGGGGLGGRLQVSARGFVNPTKKGLDSVVFDDGRRVGSNEHVGHMKCVVVARDKDVFFQNMLCKNYVLVLVWVGHDIFERIGTGWVRENQVEDCSCAKWVTVR